jgi:hypothetical protein
MKYRTLKHSQVYSEFRIRIRIDFGRLDPDPDPGGQKRPIKLRKVTKLHIFCAGCSLLRGEGFCSSLDVLYGGLGITKSQFLYI